jgi:hypothetical protein
MDPGEFGEFVFGMAVEVWPLAAKRMAEQNFGGETRRGDPVIFEQPRALLDCGAERHACRRTRP